MRLELRPYCPEDMLALLESNECYERTFGLKPADGLREFFFTGDVSPDWLAQLRSASGRDPWRFGFAVVLRELILVVGAAGFKGPPDADGMVEIAYGVAPGFQGRGLATEAAAALVTFASCHPGTRLLRAHTFHERNASTSVLMKCGFKFAGSVIDPEDGLVWRWERRPETH